MNKKKITLLVTLEFTDNITSKKDIQEITTNVCEAIQDATNGQGIAPKDGDTYTTHVEAEVMNVDWKFKVNRTIAK